MNKYFILIVTLFLFFIIFGCGNNYDGGAPQPVGSIVSITVTPSSSVVAIGSTQQFNAQAEYADGTKKAINPAWSVSNNLGSISTSGLFTGSTKGFGLVTATRDNKSGNASIVVSLSPPGTPTGLSSTNVDNNTTTLSWTTVTDAVSYIISYGTDEAATNVGTLSASSNSKNIAGLKYGTKYYAKVLGINADGDFGAFSSIYDFTTNADWTIETIDSLGNVGLLSKITTDANGKVHIAYYQSIDLGTADGQVKYATNTSGSWQYQSIDRGYGVGIYPAIAVGSDNIVRIAYSHYGSSGPTYFGSMRFAEGNFGSFVTAEVFPDIMTLYNSIALDDNNKAHLSFYFFISASPLAQPQNLIYATNASGAWVSQEVDNETKVGEYCSIALDSNGKAHISYLEGQVNTLVTRKLKYANNVSGIWLSEYANTQTDAGAYSSIAIDTNNKAHISYYCSSGMIGQELWYSTNATGAWIKTTVDSNGAVGEDTSIALDNKGNIHISYYDLTNDALKYATNKTGVWTTQTLDSSANVGEWTSIAIDNNDNIHISYYDVDNQNLKYAALK